MQTIIITPDEAIKCGRQVTREVWDHLRQQPDFVDLICMWRHNANEMDVPPCFSNSGAHIVGMILLGVDAIKNKDAMPSFVLPSLYQPLSWASGVYEMIAAIRRMHKAAPT